MEETRVCLRRFPKSCNKLNCFEEFPYPRALHLHWRHIEIALRWIEIRRRFQEDASRGDSDNQEELIVGNTNE